MLRPGVRLKTSNLLKNWTFIFLTTAQNYAAVRLIALCEVENLNFAKLWSFSRCFSNDPLELHIFMIRFCQISFESKLSNCSSLRRWKWLFAKLFHWSCLSFRFLSVSITISKLGATLEKAPSLAYIYESEKYKNTQAVVPNDPKFRFKLILSNLLRRWCCLFLPVKNRDWRWRGTLLNKSEIHFLKKVVTIWQSNNDGMRFEIVLKFKTKSFDIEGLGWQWHGNSWVEVWE